MAGKKNKNKTGQQTAKSSKPPRRRRRNRAGRMKISRAGEDFLKCAFAPVDFQQGDFQGIPDTDSSKSISLHFERNSTTTIAAGTTQTFLLAPSPGVGWYWYNATNKHFEARIYPTAKNVFGTYGSEYVTAFRMASNVMEITCLTDVLSMGGSIQVFEVPLRIGNQISRDNSNKEEADVKAVIGVGAAIAPSASPRSYVGHVRDGAYLVTGNSEPTFGWSELLTGSQKATRQGDWVMDTDGGAEVKFATQVTDEFAIRGLGTFNSKVVKITAGAKEQIFNFKTMQCVEFKPTPGSLLSRIASHSAPYDPLALAEYRKVVASLPIAVTVKENSNFWDWVVKTARSVTGVLSHIPGPVGMIASGVGALL